MSPQESNILLGIDGDEGVWGLLGSMKGAGRMKRAFNPNRNGDRNVIEIRVRIRAQLEHVLEAHDDNVVERAREAVRNIMEIDGFGHGAATRQLSLARPDRLVSVNNESQRRIREYFGRTLDITDGERFADRYAEFLRSLHSHAWFNQEPSAGFEREIWNCRAALLDAYFYSGLND